MRRLILGWLLPLLLADQALKFYIKLNFTLGEKADFVPGILELQFLENEGMAFGWALPGSVGKLLLTSFRILASVAIGFYLSKLVKEGAHKGMLRCVTLIWAGAIGNIIDGAFYGLIFTHSSWATVALFTTEGYAPLFMANVVDMFHFVVCWPQWMPFGLGGAEIFPPIWNIADAAISVGVIWILLRQRTFFDTLDEGGLGPKPPAQTKKVHVGSTSIGGDSPLRIQSMTTTDTCDIQASIAQSISLIKAGSELVRLTAPSIKDADALEAIVKGVRDAGYDTPIVADIHFTPNAAFRAADFVEKIRINPGNFADKKKFINHEYTDESYSEELVRIREKFTPLVLKCKDLGRAMRIGTNHGSLSDRITSRFGDTPLGMVESALEFIRICRDNDYHSLVISMKSSNTNVMVEAYRLLVARMEEEGMNYPLHLGVTEAGDGEDGRVKSAIGIGTLLEEGIGDTVRVSLTEAPEAELPVARILVDRYANHLGTRSELNPSKRQTIIPKVVSSIAERGPITHANFMGAGYRYSVTDDKWAIADQAADIIYTGDRVVDFAIPGTLRILVNGEVWSEEKEGHDPLWSIEQYLNLSEEAKSLSTHYILVETSEVSKLSELKRGENTVVILHSTSDMPVSSYRDAIARIPQGQIIIRNTRPEEIDKFTLFSSIDVGALLIDKKIDGVWLEGENVSLVERNRLSFGILQATRARISKTEYISCPSCGRTLFDLEETTAKIRKATNHLKGVKIGIMGCIVNGPGEMADADFGYVGTGPGKITLYREKEVVQKNVPEADGVNALIELIKSEGRWTEPNPEKQ